MLDPAHCDGALVIAN